LLWADSADRLWIVHTVAVAQSVLGLVIEPSGDRCGDHPAE
jgi:hypothetical protein